MNKPIGPDDEAEIEASKAPLLDHLIELRKRLVYSLLAFFIAFGICFFFARDIFAFLSQPLARAFGNDQSRHPFADEAAADAVTRKILGMRRASHCATGRLDRSIYSYTSACYYEIVYIQGGNLLDTVRTRMGTTVWWNALKSYVAANRYGLVTSRTLLDALDDATPLNLEPTFRARFPGLY